MAYPDLDPGKFGPGMPLDTSNLETLYKGMNKTNGFLMRNVDGRIPALQQPIGRLSIDVDNVLSDDGIVPWGNGLWRDLTSIDVRSGIAHAQKPARGMFCGVLKFNQGKQAGNPVVPWGVESYSKGTIISEGLVGYKVALRGPGYVNDYLAYLKGKALANPENVLTTYKDWIADLSGATDGGKLGLFFNNDTGFPMVCAINKDRLANPEALIDNSTFAGFAKVFEPENETVFFDIQI